MLDYCGDMQAEIAHTHPFLIISGVLLLSLNCFDFLFWYSQQRGMAQMKNE